MMIIQTETGHKQTDMEKMESNPLNMVPTVY